MNILILKASSKSFPDNDRHCIFIEASTLLVTSITLHQTMSSESAGGDFHLPWGDLFQSDTSFSLFFLHLLLHVWELLPGQVIKPLEVLLWWPLESHRLLNWVLMALVTCEERISRDYKVSTLRCWQVAFKFLLFHLWHCASCLFYLWKCFKSNRAFIWTNERCVK